MNGGLRATSSPITIQTELSKNHFRASKTFVDQNIGSEIQYLQAKSTYESQARAVDSI